MSQSAKDRILAALVPDEIVDLATALVRIPSYTTDETPVARFLDDFLRRAGLESRLQEVDPGRFQTLARLPGAGGGRSLMLNGHLDIDPIPGGWVRDPWTRTIEGDRFYGAGIFNMKAGVAAMVMARLGTQTLFLWLVSMGDPWSPADGRSRAASEPRHRVERAVHQKASVARRVGVEFHPGVPRV
jgi:hypothetical protein